MYTVVGEVMDVDGGERPPGAVPRTVRVVCVRTCGGPGCVGIDATRSLTRWRVRKCVRCEVFRSRARCAAGTQGTPWESPVREACAGHTVLGCPECAW